MAPDSSARVAYEAIASAYDDFTHRNDYEMWLGALLPELEKRGLSRGRLLDVGCGTGRAFGPMLRRGWEIVGCDVSPAMLEQAKAKFGAAVPLHVADLRELPVFGEFELVWALNDVVNYLVEDGDLELALAGMRSNLAPGGLLLFDASTLALFQASFVGAAEDAMSAADVQWKGQEERARAGAVHAAHVSGADVPAHEHRQRHHTTRQVEDALLGARMELLAALGQQDDGGKVTLVEDPDEWRDQKVIYIARSS